MRRFRPFLLYTFLGILPWLPTGCSRDLAGATTETTNGVTGSVRNGDLTPAADVVVTLFPEDFDPVADGGAGECYVDTADGDGRFRFSRVASGNYTVLVRDREAPLSTMVRDVAVTGDSITALPPATIDRSGSIATLFTSGAPDEEGYLYIPGTDVFSPVGSDGTAFLSGVPPAGIHEVILTTSSGEKRNILRDEVVVGPDDTVTILNPEWKFNRRIVLNTSSSGAGVAGNVYDFPVLIRLEGGHFDFAQAAAGGKDLLFTGSDGGSLAFEIERWDEAAGRAEIWVKVDTVYGDDSVQSITMFWGNSDARAVSNAGDVFDTAAGFEGVWHLGDDENGPVRDATINGYDGDSPGDSRPRSAEGAIGGCRAFDGVGNYLTMPNTAQSALDFPENGYYTVSAWVHLDTFDNTSHCIVSKGYEQYYLRSTYITKSVPSGIPLWEFVEFGETDKWQTSTAPASSGEWVLLTGVRQGDRQYIYCNGELVDSTVDTWWNEIARNSSNDLFIGRFAEEVTLPPVGPMGTGYNHFRGSIDEVRVLSVAQGSDWVRLCFMNQQPDDRLVVFW